MKQDNSVEQMIIERDNKIKVLSSEKEELRRQAKDARKKVRELERRIVVLEHSKGYCLEKKLKKIVFIVKKVIKKPFSWIKSIFCKRKTENSIVNTNSKKLEVEVTNVSKLEQGDCSEKKVLDYPKTNEANVSDIFKVEGKITSVSVIVCIHNALYDVEECLLSLWENRSYPYEIILVDDGSDFETREYVSKYAEITGVKLIRNEQAQGYTKSANMGLHVASGDYMILLNSDTIVTAGWVEKMITCFRKCEATGIVSPLSNAASYQSVPEIHDSVTGDWKINTLEDGITLEMMGQIVEKTSKHIYPKVPVLNGFCFMISRKVIEEIGYLDEVGFPKGYGEEVDYCLRACKAGFELRVVDDTYIFHEKSKSFSHKTRKELGKESKTVLKDKHGDSYSNIDAMMKSCHELNDIRDNILKGQNKIKEMDILHKKVAFLLTARGGSGGANSVCQEVMGMRKLGVDAYILNSSNYQSEFEKNYPELIPYVKYFNKKSDKSLLEVSVDCDIIIGTIFTTINSLKKIKQLYPDKKFGYYIQDYEPMFFSPEEDYYQEAKQSYTLLDDMCMFAKTKWIANMVEENHGMKVHIVEPSIDISMYNPYVICEKNVCEPIQITAMIRPKTERRNPEGTMKVLNMLKKKYGDRIDVNLFGCTENEIDKLGEVANFEYTNKEVLKRWEVAELLAQSHLFLDMSTYQAFGRTGLESMCLGCIAVIPEEGGADKYAIDGVNAVVVDTSVENEAFERICELIDSPEKMKMVQRNGLVAAQGYTVLKAALSEIEMLNEYCI